jgi:hypothetical protein
MSAKSVLNSSIMSNVIAGLIVAGVLWYVGKKAAGGASDAISGAMQSAKDFGATIGSDFTTGSQMVVVPWSSDYDPSIMDHAINGARLMFAPWYVTEQGQLKMYAQTATSITSEGTVK